METYIALINKKGVSLLTFQNNEIKEIQDGIFPMTFQDDYEYSRSSLGNSFGYSMKGFEKDKSISKKERFAHFLHEVNKNLKRYLTTDSNLIISGAEQERASFKHVSDFNHLILHELEGGYSSKRLTQLKQSIKNLLAV